VEVAMVSYPTSPQRRNTYSNDVKPGLLIRFPARHSKCVWITRESSAWLVLHHGNGWLFGDFPAALDEAHWLSKNCGLPIRSATL
jgi:hypothetical protein